MLIFKYMHVKHVYLFMHVCKCMNYGYVSLSFAPFLIKKTETYTFVR